MKGEMGCVIRMAPKILDLLKLAQLQLEKSNDYIACFHSNAASLQLRADNQKQVELIDNYLKCPRVCDVYNDVDTAWNQAGVIKEGLESLDQVNVAVEETIKWMLSDYCCDETTQE